MADEDHPYNMADEIRKISEEKIMKHIRESSRKNVEEINNIGIHLLINIFARSFMHKRDKPDSENIHEVPKKSDDYQQ